MKKVTALLTAVILTIASCMPVFAADDGKISVSLRIEGINGNISSKTYQTDKTNMSDFIKEADASDDSFAFTIEDSQYGSYVSAVNDETAGTFGGYDGWCFLVNGEQSSVGMSSVTLKDGDSIVFYYSCDGMQIPQINTDKISEGIISWTSNDTTYDADFNPTVTTNPVAGATVIWYSGSDSSQYTTDKNGQITIDKTLLTPGEHKLSIEKKGASGEPLVLRYAPDFTVNVPGAVPAGDRKDVFVYAVMTLMSALAAGYAFSGKKRVNEE